MAISINTNFEAISASRYMNSSSKELSKAQNQLSSGRKASDPSDDPSSSAVGSVLDVTISILKQASQNTIQAISLIQLATGVLTSTTDILNRMSTLAAQANSSTLDDSNRGMLDKEYQLLAAQIDKNAQTQWGNVTLFDGGIGTSGLVTDVLANAPLVGGATTLNAVANAFVNTVSRSGLVYGSADSVSVEKNGNVYNISVKVGNQIFAASTAPNNSGDVQLVSTTDSNNSITITYAGAVTAITDPGTFKSALESLFGISSGAPVSFQALSTQANFAAGTAVTITPGAASISGAYALSYQASDATFRISNGINVYTAQARDASTGNLITVGVDPMNGSVVFEDGTKILLTNDFDGNGDIAQQVFYFSPGSGQTSMSFQTGKISTDIVSITFDGASINDLQLNGTAVDTITNATSAVAKLDNAIGIVNQQIASLGGTKSRLDYISRNLPVLMQNTQAIKSTFIDSSVEDSIISQQQQQSLFDISSSMLQKSIQKQIQLSRLVQSVLNL